MYTMFTLYTQYILSFFQKKKKAAQGGLNQQNLYHYGVVTAPPLSVALAEFSWVVAVAALASIFLLSR